MSNLSIMYSTRTGCVKPRFKRFSLKKRMRNVCLHARHYHLCYAFSIQRWVSDTETVIIQRKISIIPPQVLPTGRGKMPEAPLLWGILGMNWRNRTRYRNEFVIGRAQWRRYGNSICKRIRGKEEIKNVGRVSKTIRNTSRVLHQLLSVMEDSKVKG
ncbi:hypothetical protein E2C01_018693 [Portunus trituberculatus]|uniref:Uncharacterized protein n=1 Tax=Portunus trituberculatus TaxID=210409 RepID=A0A5B7DXT0_PORTR|nr:hypothetical protein [Portunus trituberculatus]